MAAAVGAAIIVERTKKTLKEAGATSEETAKTPKELKLDERWLKMSANTLIPSGVVATNYGRYYLISKNEKQQ
ncbi:MAG: hypothetical protein V3S97_09075 [Candidatus Bathyarchaeia archaeon]